MTKAGSKGRPDFNTPKAMWSNLRIAAAMTAILHRPRASRRSQNTRTPSSQPGLGERVVFLGDDCRPVQGLSQMGIAGLPGPVSRPSAFVTGHPGLGCKFGTAADGGTGRALPGGEAGVGS